MRMALPGEVLEALVSFDELLLRWNQRINLTGIRSGEERARWIYAESLWGARRTAPQRSLMDVGSGCGFPGLAFKLLNPQLDVVLVESRGRKVHFLKEVIRSLGLVGVDVQQGRIEQLLVNQRSLSIENISCRGVALGEDLIEKLAASLPHGGSFIHFGARGSGDLQALAAQRGFQCRLRETFPGSRERIVVQYTKCSTWNIGEGQP